MPDLAHTFVEIDYEIFSVVICPLPLIQEGQLSVSDESMGTWYRLNARALDLRNLGPKFGPIPKAKKYVFFPILVEKFPI